MLARPCGQVLPKQALEAALADRMEADAEMNAAAADVKARALEMKQVRRAKRIGEEEEERRLRAEIQLGSLDAAINQAVQEVVEGRQLTQLLGQVLTKKAACDYAYAQSLCPADKLKQPPSSNPAAGGGGAASSTTPVSTTSTGKKQRKQGTIAQAGM